VPIASLDAPHPDIELGVARSSLRYLVRTPNAGINCDTGLVLYVAGYGMEPCDSYAESLLAYLANRYNCVAASVHYFGANFCAHARLVPLPDFFTALNRHYGLSISVPPHVDMQQVLRALAALLEQNGVKELHPDCRLAVISDEYNAMGFLPALDNLQVAHRLLAEHGLNRRRLFVIGTSYGGYIAGLMAKLAPNTFRMVIDNSGFSSADDDFPGVFGTVQGWVGGVAMIGKAVRAWSGDPAAGNFFSPPRRQIRSLLERQHVYPNTARLYAYHAPADRIAPTERKLRLREIYAGRVAYDLEIIDESRLDGRVFKTLAHGMEASMRGLFDLSYEKYLRDGGALAGETDFDLGHALAFPCDGEIYELRFSREAGVRATLAALG